MALYKGSKQLKVYKGDAKPVNVFSKGVKVAGWKEETKSGGSVLFKNTYNDKVSSLKICGNYLQESPSATLPVIPEFCSEGSLYCGGAKKILSRGVEIKIPRSVTLDDGTVVDIPLKAIKNLDEGIGECDYIEVKDGNVLYNGTVGEYTLCSKNNYVVNNDYKRSTTFQVYTLAYNTIGLKSENVGLCSHINKMAEATQNNFNVDEECLGMGARIQFRVTYVMLGCTKESTGEELTTAWKAWLDEQEANGTPLTVWYRKEKAIVRDITASDFGREILALTTFYPETEITFTGGAVLPNIEATIKVQEE